MIWLLFLKEQMQKQEQVIRFTGLVGGQGIYRWAWSNQSLLEADLKNNMKNNVK
jgi:hypothetical protein